MDVEDAELAVLVAETEAIRAAIAGDRAAFAQIYASFAPMVRGIVLASVGVVDAADVVQDVFLVALRRIEEVRDPTKFGGWLATIARTRCIDMMRRRRKLEPVDEQAWASKDPPRTDALAVLRAIRRLSPSYHETLVMRLVEGMSPVEIATRTGMTSGSVRVNLHRGLALLRADMGIGVDDDR
jgi:RNA polymerase sigma-70 factor (ECF subfamily)